MRESTKNLHPTSKVNLEDDENLTPLEKARKKASELLKINLSEPKQEKRIKALEKLYQRYASQINLCGHIYKDIIYNCDQLIDVYQKKQKELDEVRAFNENFSLLKVRLENINYSYSEIVRDLENKIYASKKLLVAYESKYVNNRAITTQQREYLKKLEDECWDNWLKALDVNKELRNTIIGFENRKALLALSKAYVDYYILVDSEISKCFDSIKNLKKEGINEYYEILRKYQLPVDKKIDFKMFLQKKIESKLADALEIKSLFGDHLDSHRSQLEGSIKEIRNQFERDQQEMTEIINYYKKFLLQKQVLFTNEAESLILYLKKRYVEKIDLLCSRFQMHNAEVTATNKKFQPSDLLLLKKIINEEFEVRLNSLKIDYSKKFIPLLDSFWHLEQIEGKKNALDEEKLIKKLSELKDLKNINLNKLIEQFKKEKEVIKGFFDKKLDLIEDVSKLGVQRFDEILKDLKKDCDVICCEVINLNARYWTKANAEFNCEARRLLIKLRHQYAPWIKSWKSGSKSWMYDYLIINLHQEVLKAAGEALVDFSPESELYLKASKALLQYNETTRKIFVDRDNMEYEQLLKLNSLPSTDMSGLLKSSNEKLDSLKEHYESYWKNYNAFYNSLFK